MSKFLRLANTEETKRYTHDNGEDYLDLRAQITKKEANALIKFAPRKDEDLDGGLRFLEKAFGDLIVGWSLEDEEGNPIKPSIQVYEQLESSAASWIDRTVGQHLRGVFGNDAEEAEGKPED